MNTAFWSTPESTGHILAYEDFFPFAGLVLRPEVAQDCLRHATAALEETLPVLPATRYMDFVRDGNRSRFEESYFRRRELLLTLTLAEHCEGQGRFTDKIIDVLWAILEESTWVVPAHLHQDPAHAPHPLPPYAAAEEQYIDLFSAATGALLSLTERLLEGALDAVAPFLRRRVRELLQIRLLLPYRHRTDLWWMGENGSTVNNWNPWVLSNILTVCAFSEESEAAREEICTKILRESIHFTELYRVHHPDGSCDEGPSYWNAAGACLFDLCHLMHKVSDGRITVRDIPLLRAIGEYEVRAHIADDFFLNFADGPVRMDAGYPAGETLYRFGLQTGSELLCRFGAQRAQRVPLHLESHYPYRTLCNACCSIPTLPAPAQETRTYFPGIQALLLREGSLFFAIKGGHNNESHNHNDVGHFVLYANGRPLLGDVGSDAYSAKTFSQDRYTLWQNQSCYHSLPTVAGYDQWPGERYRATDAVPEEKSLTLELAHAYPAEAGILRYRRRGGLQDGKATVEDTLTLQQESVVTFHLLCAVKPALTESGALLDGYRLTVSPGLSATVEEIPLSEKLTRDWQRPFLWRLSFSARLQSGTVTFCIEKE